MAKGFSLDFDGFLDLAKELGELGDDVLKKAVDNALTASKDYANAEIEKAMNSSRYNFDGQGYSKGKAKASLQKVRVKPVEWTGTIAKAYIGVDLHDAPEMIFIMHGTPHMAKDKAIYNALKVKGKHKNKIQEIQKEEFNKVIEEALND
mgnify:CR=1 FL=1